MEHAKTSQNSKKLPPIGIPTQNSTLFAKAENQAQSPSIFNNQKPIDQNDYDDIDIVDINISKKQPAKPSSTSSPNVPADFYSYLRYVLYKADNIAINVRELFLLCRHIKSTNVKNVK